MEKMKSFSLYAFLSEKNYFLMWHVKFMVFPAFLRRKLIKLQTLTWIWSSIQYAQAHIFLSVIDLMAQELFKKRLICIFGIFIPNTKEIPRK